MSDEQNRRPALQPGNGTAQLFGGRAIETAGCFVEDQDLWTFQQRSGDCDALTLTTGQSRATLADRGEISIRQRFNLRHKRIWRDVLIASLILQLIALAFPPFTQAVIDKVVVHRTQSTLIALAAGMTLFMVFTALLTWTRQYLILHTGNRVDAALGSRVFEHLFRLPPLYFQHRPTGIVAARLQGIETIREFISSAAVALVLDLPFLLVFVVVMFVYSISLTLVVLAILSIIVAASLLIAPLHRNAIRVGRRRHLRAYAQRYAGERCREISHSNSARNAIISRDDGDLISARRQHHDPCGRIPAPSHSQRTIVKLKTGPRRCLVPAPVGPTIVRFPESTWATRIRGQTTVDRRTSGEAPRMKRAARRRRRVRPG